MLVVTVLYNGPLPMEYALITEEEVADAEPILAEAQKHWPPSRSIPAHTAAGHRPRSSTAIAEREDFDAIVVGSPHRGAIGRVLIGSVAESLLSGAPIDVAVAPAGYATEPRAAPRHRRRL